MQEQTDRNKPRIVIAVQSHSGWETKVREIEAGLEEEGVPWTVLTVSQPGTIAQTAHQAAGLSPLGVGIGLDAGSVCLHFAKLPPEQPLFLTSGAGAPAIWRYYGYNAARLVKNIPFKTEPEPVPDPGAEMTQVVRRIVQKVVAEMDNRRRG
ncbi:hypothetical protein P22_0394 [Propionispora sp. 2/2-37]|uniref:glycerol dehydratase reactivase beta/small subunit family protein n=1 Tax=Propionispora sp. 2/2-37 TaxID=1677858 RepID=UPI0006BB81FD|nr:glycerol dehydratase reactivase beta/small subunit family protein [Propionispora sp. 2/2-37]CUH94328.1 hypothetical protein P22_0394 [Propionispora sp. 2/2-37]